MKAGSSIMSLTVVMAAFALLLPLPTVTHATDFNGLMSAGQKSLEEGDYSKAEEYFREAVQLRPQSIEALLFLGITLSHKKPDEAFSVFNRALLLNPETPRANLELGLLYIKRGVPAEALDYLEAVKELAPDSAEARQADELIRDIKRKALKGKRPWDLEASLGGEFDTNVILLASDVDPPSDIDDEKDYRAVFTLKGEYDFLRNAQKRVLAGYSFYQSLHEDLDDYNVQVHNLRFRGLYLVRSMTLDARYDYQATTLGGDDFSRSHSISPSLVIPEKEGMFTVFTYRLTHTEYEDGRVFPLNSEKTGNYHLVGIVQALPLSRTTRAQLGYTYDTSITEEERRDYKGHKVLVKLTFDLPYTFTADLYGEYYRRTFAGPSPQREEDRYTGSLSLNARMSEALSLTLSQAYIRNDATPEIYDYKRSITGLFLTARF